MGNTEASVVQPSEADLRVVVSAVGSPLVPPSREQVVLRQAKITFLVHPRELHLCNDVPLLGSLAGIFCKSVFGSRLFNQSERDAQAR